MLPGGVERNPPLRPAPGPEGHRGGAGGVGEKNYAAALDRYREALFSKPNDAPYRTFAWPRRSTNSPASTKPANTIRSI